MTFSDEFLANMNASRDESHAKFQAFSQALVTKMRNQFDLYLSEVMIVNQALQSFAESSHNHGVAQFIAAYSSTAGVKWSNELPDPDVEYHEKLRVSSLALIKTLRGELDFNTHDINAITPDLKEFGELARQLGCTDGGLLMVENARAR